MKPLLLPENVLKDINICFEHFDDGKWVAKAYYGYAN
jgi:hypothetical protein